LSNHTLSWSEKFRKFKSNVNYFHYDLSQIPHIGSTFWYGTRPHCCTDRNIDFLPAQGTFTHGIPIWQKFVVKLTIELDYFFFVKCDFITLSFWILNKTPYFPLNLFSKKKSKEIPQRFKNRHNRALSPSIHHNNSDGVYFPFQLLINTGVPNHRRHSRRGISLLHEVLNIWQNICKYVDAIWPRLLAIVCEAQLVTIALVILSWFICTKKRIWLILSYPLLEITKSPVYFYVISMTIRDHLWKKCKKLSL